MTVTIEKTENNSVKLNIELDAAASNEEYDKACKRLAQRVNVPGFRQGKAPKNILEKYVGVAALQREVLNSVLPKIFEETIEENKFDLVIPPNVDSYEFAEDNALKVQATMELRPEVNLVEYKGMNVEVEEYKNAEDSVEKELEVVAQRYAVLENITDRKTNETDLVNIDFTGYVDGEEIKGGSAKNYVLDLGHSNFIPGFAEQIVDKEAGQEFTIKVKFPEEYHDENLKGKDAEFNIKLNTIKERVVPEINDELAQKVNPAFVKLDDLKADISKYLENNAKMENERRVAVKLFDTLIEKTEINIQDTMINREVQALLGEFKQRINMQGGNFDAMLEQEGHEKIYAQLKDEATKRIKTSLIVGKIAKEEKVTVSGDDINGKIMQMANVYRTTTQNIVSEIQRNSAILQSINQQIITEKVTAILIKEANVSYKK